MNKRRRYVILAEAVLNDPVIAKTARGVIRYSDDDVVAVIDSTQSGRVVSDVLTDAPCHAPIVSSLREALDFQPTSLLIGSAPFGGALPASFRAAILEAADHGLEIVSGLHEILGDDEEIADRARRTGARIWDVRVPDRPARLFSGAAYEAPQVVILAVGSDCSVGKMSVMLELRRGSRATGDAAAFVATGQTGILIEGYGIAVDRCIADFIAGAAEDLVTTVPANAEYTLVEGQGSILHPAYAGVSLGLMFGSAPDVLVFCHRAGQKTLKGFDQTIPDLRDHIRLHELLASYVKPAKVAAVALNTAEFDDDSARRIIAEVEEHTGLPTDDVVRFGGKRLWEHVKLAASRSEKGRRITIIAPSTN